MGLWIHRKARGLIYYSNQKVHVVGYYDDEDGHAKMMWQGIFDDDDDDEQLNHIIHGASFVRVRSQII